MAPAFATLSRVPFAGAHSQSATEGYRVLKSTKCVGLQLWGAEVYTASSLALASSHHTATATRTFVCEVSYGRGSPATSQRALTSRGHGYRVRHGYTATGCWSWGHGRFHGTRGGAKGCGSVHCYRGGGAGWPFGDAEGWAVRHGYKRA